MRVRAATQSLVGEKSIHHGPWSDVRAVHLQPGCENMQQFSPSRSEDRIILLNLEEHLGMIAGIICGILGLLSLVLAILLCRRYSQDRTQYVNEKFYPNNSPTLSKNRMDIGGWDAGKKSKNGRTCSFTLLEKPCKTFALAYTIYFLG